MDRLIHTSLSALRAAMARQTVTANNLANVSTTGFRAEMASVQPLWVTGDGLADRAMAGEQVIAADMAPGTVVQTGRPLDVAPRGDAMIAVQCDDGSEGYTRRGDLMVADSGLLSTGDGHPVIGEGGPITLPPADSIRIADDGQVWVVPAGGDPGQPQSVGRLKLASPQGTPVAKGLDGLFRVVGGGVLASDPGAHLTAQALEGSNVNASSALVAMIDASRAWDTQIKMLTTARDLDGETANLMRLPS